jgi:sugar phosphate isomerase/epimerase
MDRRYFLGSMTLATLAPNAFCGAVSSEKKPSKNTRPPLCIFSKHLQFMSVPEMAKACRSLGLDGIDLTVRDGGHVATEEVVEALPLAVDQIRAEGLEVPMITTLFCSSSDPGFSEVVATAAQCGISFMRIGNHKYRRGEAIQSQLKSISEELRAMAHIAEVHGMRMGYHNHSGINNVGAPMWDLYQIFEDNQPMSLGSNLDAAHALVESPLGNWRIAARLLAPRVHMVSLKDFTFTGNYPQWTSLGKGVLNVPAFLALLREEADFSGPISLHFEHKTANAEALLKEIGQAVAYMRTTGLPESGYVQG